MSYREYECSEDGGSSLTAEQYKEIVSFAEWQEEERVKVDYVIFHVLTHIWQSVWLVSNMQIIDAAYLHH